MKRFALILLSLAAASPVCAQQTALASPDAKSLAMGGAAMGLPAGSHAIYGNASMALFSRHPVQISSSYCGQKEFDHYAVTGHWRFDNANLVQAGWRQFMRRSGGDDMVLDAGYSRRLGERWAVGVVGRYLRLKNEEGPEDALAADLSASWVLPLERVGSYSTLRAGARLGNLGGFFSGSEGTLPTDLTIGAAFDTFLTDAHEITVAADLGYIFTPRPGRGVRCAAGVEYNLMQLVQLRAGYHFGRRDDFFPSFGSAGAGVRILHIRLDFAYLFAAKGTSLRNAYSLSFGLDF